VSHDVAIRTWTQIGNDLSHWWWIYLSMPLVAGFIGWGTKLIAIEMMFRPLTFRGIRIGPIPLGWQGMIPRRAPEMAAIAYDMISTNLITPRELFDRIDPEELVRAVHQPLMRCVDDVARTLARDYYPGLWELMPEPVRRAAIYTLKQEAPKAAVAMVVEAQRDVEKIIDLREMVITNLTEDRALLVRMMRTIGGPDLAKIPVMGFWFGAIIGTVQAAIWALWHNAAIMPALGFLNGLVTDYIGLQMLFRPHEPKRYLGAFRWHGLFAKRRHEVIPQYGQVIADEILSPDKLTRALLTGPTGDRVFELAARHVDRAADAFPGYAKPAVVATLGSSRWQELKLAAAERAFPYAGEAAIEAREYLLGAIDIEHTVVERMEELSPDEYENLLRPAVKKDEPLAILLGAVLGFMVGEIQSQLTERIVLGHWGFPFH
jgi:uncharacterized membrane protein YheB (UPF0754 family)